MNEPPRRARTVRRRLGIVAVVVVGAVVLFAVAGLPVYVFPTTDDTRGVDAVMVLGPPQDDRFVVAEQVSDDNGGIPIVVSAPASGVDSVPVLGICRDDDVTCRTPEPFTTLGEGILLRDLAAEYGWRRIAVVTRTPHIARSRFIIGQCFSGDVRMTSSGDAGWDLGWWAEQYVYQTAAFVKALFTPC